MPPSADQIANLLELTRKKSWSALEGAWSETLGDPVTDPRFYAQLTQLLKKLRRDERLERLVIQVTSALNDAGLHLEATRILRTVLRGAPELESLREPLMTALTGAYGEREGFSDFVAASELETSANLGKALLLFELMMTTIVGSVYRHKSWGVGVVTSQDVGGRTVTIDFPARKEQTVNFSGIREFLERIPPTHIRTQIATDVEGLRARLKDEPVAVIKQVLENSGGLVKQGDLKGLFVPSVYTPAQWSRWWTTAKDRLRLDPWVEVQGTGAHGRISLREEARGPTEVVLSRFQEATTHHARHQAVREAVRFLKSGALSAEDLRPVVEYLHGEYQDANRPSDKLSWAYFAEEVVSAANGEENPLWRPDTAALLSKLGGDVDLVRGLELSDHQSNALEQALRTDHETFAELCMGLIDEVPLTLAKWMMNELLADPKLHRTAEDALGQLLHDPSVHTEAYLWAMRQVLGGPWAHLSVSNDAPHLLGRTLTFLDGLQRRIDREDPQTQALRGLATRIRNALEENHHELIVHTLRELPTDQARALNRKMMGMTALSDAWKGAVAISLLNVRDDLDERAAVEHADDVHLVTAEKIREKTKELEDIRTVQIPENSSEIQIAREHGDLRENAEYKAAKERQVLLHRRAEELQELLGKARPFHPETVSTDSVTPGTRIRVRNLASGQEETYALLGVWDADPDQGIISYGSPFGAQFLRRSPGETLTVELPSGESLQYEVCDIERAI